MNGIEMIIMGMAYAMLVGFAYRAVNNGTRALLYALALVPVLALAIEGVTQFLTCDETYMILELENVRSTRYRQWTMGGYRTSILVTGSLVQMLQDVLLPVRHTATQLHALTKAIHWLVGFGVLGFIHEALRRYFVPREQQPLFFVVFMGVALMLPTNILALKVANYDLLSTMLGVLSLVLALGALSSRSLRPALAGIVVGSLASQEKVIASPFLAVAIFSAVFVAATWTTARLNAQPTAQRTAGKRTGSGRGTSAVPEAEPAGATVAEALPWLRVASVMMISVLTAVLTTVFSWIMVDGMHGGLTLSLERAVEPLIGYITLLHSTSEAGGSIVGWAFPVAMIGIGAAAISASILYRSLRQRMTGISVYASSITSLVLVVFAMLGAYGTYAYTTYIYPYHPLPEGIYLPTKAFNDAIAHFMQPTYASHMAAIISVSYGVIANGLPTAIWVALAAVGLWGILGKRRMQVSALWSVTTLIVLLFPLAYAVTQTPIGSRYLNLFLFVIAVFAALALTAAVATALRPIKLALPTALLLLMLAELGMFRPFIASFTPVWNRFDAAFASKPLYGVGKTGHWSGWGEENFIAGSRIAQEFRKPGERIRIHCSYPGDWLTDDTTITFAKYNEFTRNVTSSDYYILSRAAVYQQRYPFPHGQKPLFTLDYGGATMAWIFRGDQLRNTIMFVAKEQGGGFIAPFPERLATSNDAQNPQRSPLVVYENGKPLGPAHAPFDSIRTFGKGRYNHWQDVVFFTTSDNSDPRSNGRTYEVR